MLAYEFNRYVVAQFLIKLLSRVICWHVALLVAAMRLSHSSQPKYRQIL